MSMPGIFRLIALLACCALGLPALCVRAVPSYASPPHSSEHGTRVPSKNAGLRNIPITPGLRGFGITSVGGSGRHTSPPRTTIFLVSSLRDSGANTLRECVEFKGPRTCLFEVGGEIQLRTALRIRYPYISIAGQTAPSPGITLSHGGFAIETHDVFIQHIAIRPGDYPQGVQASSRDGVSIGTAASRGAYNVVLDHLSATWAIDENISTWYKTTRDVTISNSIIAEGLHRSIHPKGPHSKGIMIGDNSKRISLYRNLISSNEERNPYLKPGSETEMINNVVYGWGSNGGWSLCNLTNNERNRSPVKLSFIGNTYIPGPWSYVTAPVYAKRLARGSRVYTRDSTVLGDTQTASSSLTSTNLPGGLFHSRRPPVRSRGKRAVRRENAIAIVLRNAGSRPFDRSAIDARIVSDVRQRSGSLKDCISGCSRAVGFLPAQTEKYRRLEPPRRPFGDDNNDGYTNLENWIFDFPNP